MHYLFIIKKAKWVKYTGEKKCKRKEENSQNQRYPLSLKGYYIL